MRQCLPAILSIAVLGVIVGVGPAAANDGGIANGGTPGLLSGHPSVRMQREVVRMDIYGKTVKTTARFWFVNTGKTCTVRMGFPDQGQGADNPDEDQGPEVMHRPPRTNFYQLQLLRQRGEGANKAYPVGPGRTVLAYQVGDVSFASTGGNPGYLHAARLGEPAKKGSYKNVGYVVHTGSSWHGTIGRSILTVST